MLVKFYYFMVYSQMAFIKFESDERVVAQLLQSSNNNLNRFTDYYNTKTPSYINKLLSDPNIS
jgi:hypothetical protein